MSVPVDRLPPPRWDLYRGSQRSAPDQFQVAAAQHQPDDVEWADYAKTVMSGGAGLVQSAGWLAGVLGAENIGSSIEELGRDAVDFWTDSLSDPAKAEISKEIIRKNDNGEYEWGDASFSTIGLMGAQSLLGTAAGMGVGAGLTKVLQVFANPFGRATLAAGAAAGSAQAASKLKLVDAVIGAGGFGVGEGAIGGISAGASVYDNIMGMDHEKLMANERYQQVYNSTDETISELERHQYAADTVAKEASTSAGWQSGLTTALLGAPMGAYFGRILGGAKLSSTLTRGIATGAAGEAAQEFAQSGAERIISNIATQPFDPSIDVFDDVLNDAVGGAMAGGLLGGGFGVAGVGDAKIELASEQQDNRDAVGGALKTAAKRAAEAGADQTAIIEIVRDATAQQIDVNEAMDFLGALENEANTGEPAIARRVPPEPPQAQPEPAEAVEEPEVAQDLPQEALDSELETVDPRSLEVDAERFQFKAQTDKAGVSDRLKGVETFDKTKAGVAIVYEQTDGKRFIVDGHQRKNLATRAIESGQDPAEVQLPAYILREADGVTAEEATFIAATKNIAEGSGSPIDAAKVLRQTGIEGEREFANLPPTSRLVQQAKGLRNLDEDAFAKAVNEVIDPRYAAIVGESVQDGPLQNAAIEVLRQTAPDNAAQARAVVDQVKTAGTETTTTEDLFGENVVTESLYGERAKVLDAALKSARKDKATFKTLTDKEAAITGTGKNKLDTAANQAKISDANRALTALSTVANQKGPISDALTAAARQVKAGEKPGSVAQGFLKTAVASLQTGDAAGRKPRKPAKKTRKKPAVKPADVPPDVTSENLITTDTGLFANFSRAAPKREGLSWKGSVGQFNYWQRGPNDYVVTQGADGDILSTHRQFNQASSEAESLNRRSDLQKEEARRDRIRNTGQLDMFSRGKPLRDVRLSREFEVEETGELVTVEQNAEVLLRQHDKRINVVQQLRACIRG